MATLDLTQVHSGGGQLPEPHLEGEVAPAEKERLLLTHPERLENKSSKDESSFQVKGLFAIKAPTLFKGNTAWSASQNHKFHNVWYPIKIP